jgi:hypothetical protein
MLTAERLLRRYDKALRLRKSFESDTLLLERKTFRGRIGSIGPEGLVWSKDVGRRREEGHLLLLSIHRDEFDVSRLLTALRQADTWKQDVPMWRQVEEHDERVAEAKVRRRKDFIRYKASNLFDNYVWRHKQRINVPIQVR